MIGNTHFDPVWLWRWDEAMASIRATFRSALDRMNEDGSFIYSFATPPVFEWIKKTDPEMMAEITKRIAEGRWELCEAWWVQPDCYSASAESYIRQGLLGQRYLKENFGRYSDTVFNIDSFGHSPMLPQILKKSGVDYYCFMRPEKRHIELEHPLFLWKSPDGSQVLSYRVEHAYSYDINKIFSSSEDPDDEVVVYGVTDHGGAPTKAAISAIHSEPRAHFSTVSDFFKSHHTDYVVDRELLTGDFGPYSNYSEIKRKNRVAEYALLNAEKASLISGETDRSTLNKIWGDVLFNQFHDILGGACIKDAYIDAENQLGRAIFTANEIMHCSLQSVTRHIATPGKNPDTAWNLVIWNLNATEYDGYMEAEVQWMHEFPAYDGEIALEDNDGNRYECQIVRAKSVINRFRSRFIFKARIPSLGYKVFKVVKLDTPTKKYSCDPFTIVTDRIKAVFSKENGYLLSIEDVKSSKIAASNLLVPMVYEDKGDTWCFNIKSYESEAIPFSFEGFDIIECGPLMTEIKGSYRFRQSKLEIYYRFYKDTPYFDVRYRANWDERHTVLKLELDVNDVNHTVATPATSVKRGETHPDVPLGAWIATDKLTVAADSIFAYNTRDKKLGLTVLRSAIYGDLRISDIDESLDYDIIDRGIVKGKLRVGFDVMPWKMADELNNPPIIIDESNHGGNLPAENSYLDISNDSVLLSTAKVCEDSDATIIRLIETEGNQASATLTLFGHKYSVSLSPYEIKTMMIDKEGCHEVNMLEQKSEESDR